MNRNVESHFALNPTRIDLSRSTFGRSSSVKTSFNAGDIVPFFLTLPNVAPVSPSPRR